MIKQVKDKMGEIINSDILISKETRVIDYESCDTVGITTRIVE